MSVPLPDASSSSIDAEAEESTFSPKNYTDEVVSDTVISSIKEPIQVIYCPKCTWPPEFCEFGPSYKSDCLPWITANCPEVLGEVFLAKKLAGVSLEDSKEDGDAEAKKSKRGPNVGVPRKKAAAPDVYVVVSRAQRQKKKYITTITGLDTVADLKIKDVSKACGKKFSSGASIGETATGTKEVVIQGDVYFEVPPLLISEFKIAGSSIFLQEDNGSVRPYE